MRAGGTATNSADAGENLKADVAEIQHALILLCHPDEVYELRALGTSKGTVSGYFDDLEKLARCSAECSEQLSAGGVYITLNPVDRDLLARANNRLKSFAKHTTADIDVVGRRWLILDFDPARPAGISATDEERAAALSKGRGVLGFLRERGWPEPIVIDSGNGLHALYPIDLPNDDATRDVLKRVLESLAACFDDARVCIDRTMYNAARIVRIAGTVNRKGDSLADRPHRVARILEGPNEHEIVTREQLEEIAAILPDPASAKRDVRPHDDGRFNLDSFLERHLSDKVKRTDSYQGGRRFILEACIFDPNHRGTSAAIIERAGAIGYACKHNSCARKHWSDVRELFEPGYRDRRASASVRNGKQVPATTASTSQTAEMGVITSLSDVEPEEVEWLWRDRFALGKLNLLVGDPGNGKSFVTLDTAARASTGADFPDGSPGVRGSVILITGEDGIADTVRPRLDAQGSDLTKIHQLKIKSGDSERQFDIGAHLDQLREKIREIGDVRLLIIDPLTAYLGDVDPNKDSRVRGLLTPFATLAEETRVAILAVMHLNKAAVMDAIYRVTGSVAFIAQARSAWVVLPDPQDLSRRLFLKLKANLAPADIPGLAFTIAANEQGRPVLAWSNEPVTVNLRDVMGGFSNTRRGPKPNKLEAAKALITDVLGDGRERPGAGLDAAARTAGISIRTLNDAAKALGVRRRKAGFAGGWLWSLNPQENPAPSLDSDRNSATSTKPAENKDFSEDRNSASSSANSEGAEFMGNGKSLHLQGTGDREKF